MEDEKFKNVMINHRKIKSYAGNSDQGSMSLSLKPTEGNSNGSQFEEKENQSSDNKLELPDINEYGSVIRPARKEIPPSLLALKNNKFFKKKQKKVFTTTNEEGEEGEEEEIQVPHHKKVVSAHDIFNKYLSMKSSDFRPKLKDDNIIMAMIKNKLKKKKNSKLLAVYGISNRKEGIYKKFKNDMKLPLKDDFYVEEYQSILLKIFKENLALENYYELSRNFDELNKLARPKKREAYVHKTSWYYLAKELENKVPQYLVDKFYSMGQSGK